MSRIATVANPQAAWKCRCRRGRDFRLNVSAKAEIWPRRGAGRSERIPFPNAAEPRLFRRRDRFRPALARAISRLFDGVLAAHENGCFPSENGHFYAFFKALTKTRRALTKKHERNGSLEPASAHWD